MGFADRVVRMRRKAKVRLTDIEQGGDPFALAAENIRLAPDMEESDIAMPRASSLYDACMRMHVLGTIHRKTQKRWTGVGMRVTFGIGGALHYWMQNTPEVFGNNRRGWWKCLACGRVLYFGGPPKTRCRFCRALPAAIVYREHSLRIVSDQYRVTGHPDMFVAKEGVHRVNETKSINGDQFDTLVAPLAAHEYQCQTYMWALQIDRRMPVAIDPEIGYVSYISKKHASGKLPIKMFVIRRDAAMIRRISDKLMLYTDGLRDPRNAMPPMDLECARKKLDCFRSRNCPCLGECKGVG